MISTLDEFIVEYEKIKSLGWTRTHRSGPTGVGKTLEDLLGIKENNLGEPDFGEYELKSCRKDSQSMLTMLTKSPQPPKSNSYLLEKYGYSSDAYDNNKKVLHATLTAERFVPIADTGKALKISCDNEKIYIESKDGAENVYWDRQVLKQTFERKYKNKFVYAKAQSRGTGNNEEFYYEEAYELSGFDYDGFVRMLESGKIFVDLRIGQNPDGSTHDHGTGFRIRETDQPSLFIIKKKLV